MGDNVTNPGERKSEIDQLGPALWVSPCDPCHSYNKADKLLFGSKNMRNPGLSNRTLNISIGSEAANTVPGDAEKESAHPLYRGLHA
jgi:hypothetical protein